MNQRSNISTSLGKKRRRSFLKRVFAYLVFILFFICLGVYVLTTEKARIKSIDVSGNVSVFSEDIVKIVNDEIGINYLWIIPTDNIILLRRYQIKNDILENIKKISSVKIIYKGVDKIEIHVTEREIKSLWCDGTPVVSKSCYFIDKSGFIFEQAPTFSSDTYFKFFGLIKGVDPIGQFYFKNNFSDIYSLFDTLKNMSFKLKYFIAKDEHEYEIYLLGDGKILINDKKSFESSLLNLRALIDSGYIKTDTDSIKKIKYIDLRFGNKVNFEFNK